jgi:hypothetical protein
LQQLSKYIRNMSAVIQVLQFQQGRDMKFND